MRTAYFAIPLVLAAVASGFRAQAQGSGPQAATEQALMEQLRSEAGTTASSAQPGSNFNSLTQYGTGNRATAEQADRSNLTQLVQVGSYNEAVARQMGIGNRTTVTQLGSHNAAVSEIRGNETESDIVQNGNYNQVNQRLNVDGRQYSVEQYGNNNQLTQSESGAAAPPGYEVRMVGNGIRVTIEQGRVVP